MKTAVEKIEDLRVQIEAAHKNEPVDEKRLDLLYTMLAAKCIQAVHENDVTWAKLSALFLGPMGSRLTAKMEWVFAARVRNLHTGYTPAVAARAVLEDVQAFVDAGPSTFEHICSLAGHRVKEFESRYALLYP